MKTKIFCLLLLAFPIFASAQVADFYSHTRNGTKGIPPMGETPTNQITLNFYHDTAPVILTGFQFIGSLPSNWFANIGCGEPDPIEGERFQYLWAQTNYSSTTQKISSEWIPAQFYVHAGETCSAEVTDFDTESQIPPAEVRVNYQWTPCTPDNPISASSTICTPEQANSSSSAPLVYNGLTYGEIIISLFGFLSFAMISYAFLFFWLRGFKIRQ